MNVVIRKIGNSEGIIIPKDLLNRLGVKEGDSLELTETTGGEWSIRVADADFSRQVQAALHFMDKYKTALKKLAE